MKKLWRVSHGSAEAIVMAHCSTSAVEIAGALFTHGSKVVCLGLYHSESEGVEPHVIMEVLRN